MEDYINELVEWYDRSLVPNWWHDNGNRLFLLPGMVPPLIVLHPGLAPPTCAIIKLACDTSPSLMLWGHAPEVVIGRESRFPDSSIACGGGSSISIGAYVFSGYGASIDARNGGSITVGDDGLWSSNIVFATDDMHAIRDNTGKRLNAFGGMIEIGEHVWLGRDTVVMGGAQIGSGSIIGARSIVRKPVPQRCVAVGAPLRIVRDDVNWTHGDEP